MKKLLLLCLAAVACSDPIASFNQICTEGWSATPAADYHRGSLSIVLDPRFSDAETEEARQACVGWEDVGVPCTVYRDHDDVPDAHHLPVAKCEQTKFCTGMSACTFPRHGDSGTIAVMAPLHRRLLAHELGHALKIRSGYWHAPCDRSSILGVSLSCMADGPSLLDAEMARDPELGFCTSKHDYADCR